MRVLVSLHKHAHLLVCLGSVGGIGHAYVLCVHVCACVRESDDLFMLFLFS